MAGETQSLEAGSIRREGSGRPSAASSREVPRWEWPLVLALAVVAAISVVITTRKGVAITPDSVTYVSAAQNMAHGRGVVDFTGQALTNFPPGYSGMLAVGEAIGVSLWEFGRFLGASIYAGIVVLAYLLLRRHVRSTPFVIGAIVLIACSTQMVIISGAIASDATLIVLTIAFVLVLDRINTTDRHLWLLIASAAGLVALAFLVRYAAAALLLSGAISLFAIFAKEGIGTALRRTAAFVGLALIVPVLWVARNATSDNPDVLGFRVPSNTSIPGLVKGFVLGAAHVVLPEELSTAASFGLLLGGLLLVIVVVWPLRPRVVALAREDLRSLAPMVIVVVVFAAFLLWSERTVGADDMPRQFLPIWPLLATLTTVFLVWVTDSDRGERRWRSGVLNAIALLFVIGSVVWFTRTVVRGTPTYYVTGTDAELQASVATIPDSDLIISNDPWRVYLSTGRKPVQLAPVPSVAGFSHRPVTAEDVRADLCTRPVTLIWFENSPASQAMGVQGLVGGPELELTSIARIEGGELYRVTPAPSARGSC